MWLNQKTKKAQEKGQNRQAKTKRSTNPASDISSGNSKQEGKQKKSAFSALKIAEISFGGHKSDLISLGLIVIGIVAALGLYFDTAGVVGQAIGLGFFCLFGYIGFIAPAALIRGLYLILNLQLLILKILKVIKLQEQLQS